jgi:hypothetical protein
LSWRESDENAPTPPAAAGVASRERAVTASTGESAGANRAEAVLGAETRTGDRGGAGAGGNEGHTSGECGGGGGVVGQ